ncbi:MAG: hypothetical protein N4A36_01185 [Candidatus Gracilibacteria bacterium]|jgi:hypothetical protein|nr:hypothetical protein [Candidatus Gracilibacteria bacterium]
MKKTFFVLFLLFSLPACQAAPNSREVFSTIEDDTLAIQGLIRPYSNVKVYYGQDEIANSNADERGFFSISVDDFESVDSQKMIMKAYDLKGEAIYQKEIYIPEQNSLNGSIAENFNEEVFLVNKDGKYLDKAYVNQNGGYFFENAPKDAEVVTTYKNSNIDMLYGGQELDGFNNTDLMKGNILVGDIEISDKNVEHLLQISLAFIGVLILVIFYIILRRKD